MDTIKEKLRSSKVDIIQSSIIAILAIVVLLNNFSLVAQFLGKLNPLAGYEQSLERAEQRKVILEFDRVRLEDATNALLAIQDYYFQKKTFPESLEDLKKEGYLDPNSRLADPGTSQPYFYQKREQDFVLCVWLSDMLKGVNTANCPSSAPGSETVAQTSPGSAAVAQASSDEENKTPQPAEKKLRITGDVPTVNVREQPTTASAVIAKVVPDDTYIFTEQEGDWYHITVNEEKNGWVRNDYAEPLTTE